MPDENGFPTDEELLELKEAIKTLIGLDANFQYLQTIGEDVTQLRQNRDNELARLKTIVNAEEKRRAK